ncbi:MAG: glycerol dehydrogenase [Clostridiales bacterium]|nr:glycerol dehydrogenase [Clostridiales bacterium]
MAIAMKAPAKYVQGSGELKNLGLNTKKMGERFLVIASENGWKRFGETVAASFAAQEHTAVFSAFCGEATKAEVFRQMDVCKEEDCQVIVGMGGGKAIDTAKAAAENLGLPCVVVPTVASNDAPCSGVAVLYNEAGVVIKAVLTKRNPDLVLVDTELIANAPARLLVAGMGDALATWFEARACKKSGARTMARGQATETAMMMARLCYDLLIQYGADALESVKAHTATPALEKVVEASILLSGVGFESGGLAVAHAVNDGFALEPQCHGCYHGEKVAYGLLVQLVLEKAPEEEMKEVLTFMKAVGLPMTLKQLGIETVNDENIHKVAEAACVPTQSTKNLSADITADDVYAAIYEADRIGSAFLND